MKVIFLDVDGTMNSGDSPTSDLESSLSKKHMQVLNYLVKMSQAKLVLSSSFRYGKTVNEIQKIFERKGFVGEFISKTPSVGSRTLEILEWIKKNKVDSFVILDDAKIGEPLSSNHVNVYPSGLIEDHIEETLEILNQSNNHER